VQPTTDDEALRFGHFEIRPGERVLRLNGQSAAVGARAFDLLLALARLRERMVTKQELLDLVWPGVVVEEHNIAAQISSLRKLLGPHVIATVPGRGYRFIALPEGAGAPDGVGTSGPAPVASVQTRLPHHLTPLLGRDDDLTALAALLQRYRLITIVGAGGMGKTLLAQHLLSRRDCDYVHGVCWVELAGVNDGVALPLRIAEALGVRPGEGEPLAGLCAAVSPLGLLLALDNAEHLLADVARTAAALLEAAPDLRLVVTSQAPLRLAAERVYRVGPLAVPQGPLPAAPAQAFSAVALFVERAHGADARFVLTDAAAPAAIELCRQLDGLPLAIELAAARAPLLGVAQLAASMQDRLKLLTRNLDAAAPARQQTLRATLEWSHGMLDERERTVFRRFGVMAGSASLALIQQVVADESGPLDAWAVLDALGTLVDRSLVAVLADDEPGEPGEPRYRLLESPRLLALEQLRSAGEEEELRRRHASALAAAFDAEWHERWSGRIGALRWQRRTLADASNARDAIAWARSASEPATAVAIAATLFTALPRSSYPELMALGDLCESLAGQVASTRLRLRAWEVAVRPFIHRQQPQSVLVAAKAMALARELDREAPDHWLLYEAISLWIKAESIVVEPSPVALRDALAELALLEDPRWPAQRLTRGLEARRLACIALGGPDQPGEHLALSRQVIAGLEAEGADTAPMTSVLIDAELECGHTQAAIRLGEQLLEHLASTRDEWSRMLARSNLALAWLALDDVGHARPIVQALWPAALQFNLHVLCSDTPALLAALEGRPHTAARLLGYADATYAARGIRRHPLEVAARRRCEALARAALGDAIFDRLFADGRHLRDEQVAALAFAIEDPI
jgi:predicted ATPase/DNA-binding winged helix-turn-helix (wHTH) protein